MVLECCLKRLKKFLVLIGIVRVILVLLLYVISLVALDHQLESILSQLDFRDPVLDSLNRLPAQGFLFDRELANQLDVSEHLEDDLFQKTNILHLDNCHPILFDPAGQHYLEGDLEQGLDADKLEGACQLVQIQVCKDVQQVRESTKIDKIITPRDKPVSPIGFLLLIRRSLFDN